MNTNKFLIALLVVFALYSCSNDQEQTADNQKYVSEKTILTFASQAEFDETLASLETMNNAELKVWTNSKGYNSLYNVFCDAVTESSTLTSATAYTKFKEKHADALYFPETNEDYGPYLPLKNEKMSALLNPKGEVMIGGKTVNLKDITSYNQLVELKRAIPQEKSKLRATSASCNYYEAQKGKYMLWIDVIPEPRCPKETSTLHVIFNFRKYVEGLGWVNYEDYSGIMGTLHTVNSRGQKMEIPCDASLDPKLEAFSFSPHHFQLPWPESYTSHGEREFATTTIEPSAFLIQYLGFGPYNHPGEWVPITVCASAQKLCQ